MKLRKLNKQGKEMFTKDYSKQKSLAEAIINSHSTYSSGEKQWEVVADEPKKMGRPKKNTDEDS